MEHLIKAQKALNDATLLCIGLNACIAELIKLESVSDKDDDCLSVVLTKMELGVQAHKLELLLGRYADCLEIFTTSSQEYFDAKQKS